MDFNAACRLHEARRILGDRNLAWQEKLGAFRQRLIEIAKKADKIERS
ncbi:MAG: hypothetical protein M0R74_13515 [Dehalococcoidia bacterium]|jgi:hypothetical protein|nr:hypothetical protein [Dehalococcoidia bacterium]